MINVLQIPVSTIVIINIISLTPTANSLDCTVFNEIMHANFYMDVMLNHSNFGIPNVVCLDEGTEYELIVRREVNESQDIRIFELDSVSST